MGQVYAAYDADLDRRVALKLLHTRLASDPSRRDQLLVEARAMARVDHPNVIAVFDAGVHGGVVYLAMALVQGPSLDTWLQTTPTQRAILDVFIGAARGLEAAHQAGVIHRDFKPANVLVTPGGQAKVGDFGVAGFEGGEDTRADGERAVGSPAYMSPEHIAGVGVDARSDQFSFCVALAEALHGERPFAADSLPRLAHKILQGDVSQSVDRAPGALGRLLRKGLDPDPSGRHASMADVARALERIRHPAWPRRLAVAGLLGVAVAAVSWPPANRSTCKTGLSRVANVRDTVRSTVAVDGEAYTEASVEAALERYISGVDAYARAWAQAYDESCAAVGPVRSRGTDGQRVQAECLEHRRASLGGLVEFVSTGEVDAEHLAVLVDALPSLEDCARGRWTPYPTDPEVAAKVAAVDRELERVRRMRLAKRTGLLEAARAVERAARDTDDTRVIAAAIADVARAEADAGQEDAFARFDEALQVALAHGHAEVAARTVNHLLIAAKEKSEPDPLGAYRRLAAVGFGLAERVQAPVLSANLALNFSSLLRRHSAYADAEEHLDRAIALYDRAGSVDGRVRARLNKIVLAARRGNSNEIMLLAEALRKEIEHPDARPETAVLGGKIVSSTLYFAGRLDLAETAATQALARAQRDFAEGSELLGEAAWMVALVALQAGAVRTTRSGFSLSGRTIRTRCSRCSSGCVRASTLSAATTGSRSRRPTRSRRGWVDRHPVLRRCSHRCE